MVATRLTTSDFPAEIAHRCRRELDESRHLSFGGNSVEISARAHSALAELFDALAAGKAVDITPVEEFISTREAAALLGVSRPTLVKLLDEGHIDFDRPGSHRRVRRESVEDFLETRRSRRAGALTELAESFDEYGPDTIVDTR